MPEVTADDVAAARPAVEAIARRTPVLSSRTISERAGGVVSLKAENLQLAGSFKIRGVSAKLAALGEDGCSRGVVAASAGNHAQSLAAAARARGVPCEVFVPDDAPMAKVEAARGQGAIVHMGGGSVDDCLALALERADDGGLAFVHPFDDPDIVAGQGSLGLELLEDVPDLARVVVPVGGGGLCSGVAIAVKSARPEVEVIGVQAAACAPTRVAAARRAGARRRGADDRRRHRGQAPGRPHARAALAARRRHRRGRGGRHRGGDGRADGALQAGGRGRRRGRRRGPARRAGEGGGRGDDGRRAVGRQRRPGPARLGRAPARDRGRPPLVVLTRVPDRPGNLAHLLAEVAATGANIVDVAHVREGLDLHVRETAVELVMETRGHEHAREVVAALNESGYQTRVLH